LKSRIQDPANACSMRAHEMEPEAQCSERRRACTGYGLSSISGNQISEDYR